jgi:hypothetical protein
MNIAKTTPHFAWIAVLSIGLLSFTLATPADARPGERGAARASVNRPSVPRAPRAQPAQRPNAARNTQNNARVNTGNRANSGNKNRVGNRTNINNSHNNVNVNRDVNIDVDGHGRYGYDDHYHPIATAAAVTATVAVTSAVVGSILRPAQMPTSCVQVIRTGVTYMQCGSAWYQPQYVGSDVTYVVVDQPY